MQQKLNPEYLEMLERVALAIQDSPERVQFMDGEEEADYKAMQDAFEPYLQQVHTEVAKNDPLQLVAVEEIMLNSAFEGLFLPRILGYSVLRGQVNDQYKYTRPQDHFKEILSTIIESSNFEFIKKRIGQSVQVGFALSSDIWITDLINAVKNKRLRYYLISNKQDKYRDVKERKLAYDRYQRQFSKENFHSTDFPTTFSELKVNYPSLKHFLMYRAKHKMDNVTLNTVMDTFVNNVDFYNTDEHLHIMVLAANFFKMNDEATARFKETFNKLRVEVPEFVEKYLSFMVEMNQAGLPFDAEADLNAAKIVDKNIKDALSEYYWLAEVVHTKGYAQADVITAVRAFYETHEGRSTVNHCVRNMIFSYLYRAIVPLTERQYLKYFEISKIYTAYINIFTNQQFNQNIKDISMEFIQKCLKKFIDKRSRDYQDIKRFVSTVFIDLNFLKDKEVVEMFKTRRKRKTEGAAEK